MKAKANKANKSRCNSAVSATAALSQQSVQKSPNVFASEKLKTIEDKRRYRPSSTSATMRIPHELRAQVAAIVARYREQHCDDPDRW